ncbi:hypothetical protein HZS_2469 [Henneguya salminicola]|nr:hypothetical protein HZS_2469 [Henneguya salminicola]
MISYITFFTIIEFIIVIIRRKLLSVYLSDSCKDFYFDIEGANPFSNYPIDLCDFVKTKTYNSYEYYLVVELFYDQILIDSDLYATKLSRFFDKCRENCNMKNYMLTLNIRKEHRWNFAIEIFHKVHNLFINSDTKLWCCVRVYDLWILSQLKDFCQDICLYLNEETNIENIVENVNKLNLSYKTNVMMFGPRNKESIYFLQIQWLRILFAFNKQVVLSEDKLDWNIYAPNILSHFMYDIYSDKENRQVKSYFENSHNGFLMRNNVFNSIICKWVETRNRIRDITIKLDHPIYVRKATDGEPDGMQTNVFNSLLCPILN